LHFFVTFASVISYGSFKKVGDIFDFSIDYMDELEARLQKLNEENTRLAAERAEAISVSKILA